MDHRAGESLRDFVVADAADKPACEIQSEEPGDSGGVAIGNTECLAKVSDRAVKHCAVMKFDVIYSHPGFVQQVRSESMGPVDQATVNGSFREACAVELEAVKCRVFLERMRITTV